MGLGQKGWGRRSKLKSTLSVEHGLQEPDNEDTKNKTTSPCGHTYASEQCKQCGCARAAWFWNGLFAI